MEDNISHFLTPSADYKNLTAQVDFLGNHSLSSDMRSVTLPASKGLKIGFGFIAVMTIVLVVPMILFLVWNARELRNLQKRNQMRDSAEIFVKSTPVPSEKVSAMHQFQFS